MLVPWFCVRRCRLLSRRLDAWLGMIPCSLSISVVIASGPASRPKSPAAISRTAGIDRKA
jgi:hypothetical protein